MLIMTKKELTQVKLNQLEIVQLKLNTISEDNIFNWLSLTLKWKKIVNFTRLKKVNFHKKNISSKN